MRYHVHANLVALWKKQLQEHAAALFEKEGKEHDKEEAARKKEPVETEERSEEIALCGARQGDMASESGVGSRYHVCEARTRVRVPHSDQHGC